MNDYTNEYEIKEEALREYSIAWYRHTVFPLYNRMIVTVVFLMGLVLIRIRCDMTGIYLCAIMLLVGILAAVSYFHAMKSGIKATKKQMETAGVQFGQKIIITLHKDIFKVSIPDSQKDKEFSKAELSDHFQSRNYIYLITKDRSVLPFKKDGFSEGTCSQLLSDLKKCPKVHSIRAWVLGIVCTALALYAGNYIHDVYMLFKALGIMV